MSKVINLFARSLPAENSNVGGQGVTQLNPLDQLKDDSANSLNLKEIEDRNAAMRERMRKERADANKSVLRSYRIK